MRESLLETADDRAGVSGPPFVTVVVVIATANMLIGGVWAFLWPESFATFVQFPYQEGYRHFLHDAGAFTIGLGTTLLLALWWRDAIAVALAGFGVATGVHAASHYIDRNLGGWSADWIVLTILALIVVAALVVRLRFLGQRSPMP
jgi:hypothetical protein